MLKVECGDETIKTNSGLKQTNVPQGGRASAKCAAHISAQKLTSIAEVSLLAKPILHMLGSGC